jgi:hypothetical protein
MGQEAAEAGGIVVVAQLRDGDGVVEFGKFAVAVGFVQQEMVAVLGRGQAKGVLEVHLDGGAGGEVPAADCAA